MNIYYEDYFNGRTTKSYVCCVYLYIVYMSVRVYMCVIELKHWAFNEHMID